MASTALSTSSSPSMADANTKNNTNSNAPSSSMPTMPSSSPTTTAAATAATASLIMINADTFRTALSDCDYLKVVQCLDRIPVGDLRRVHVGNGVNARVVTMRGRRGADAEGGGAGAGLAATANAQHQQNAAAAVAVAVGGSGGVTVETSSAFARVMALRQQNTLPLQTRIVGEGGPLLGGANTTNTTAAGSTLITNSINNINSNNNNTTNNTDDVSNEADANSSINTNVIVMTSNTNSTTNNNANRSGRHPIMYLVDALAAASSSSPSLLANAVGSGAPPPPPSPHHHTLPPLNTSTLSATAMSTVGVPAAAGAAGPSSSPLFYSSPAAAAAAATTGVTVSVGDVPSLHNLTTRTVVAAPLISPFVGATSASLSSAVGGGLSSLRSPHKQQYRQQLLGENDDYSTHHHNTTTSSSYTQRVRTNTIAPLPSDKTIIDIITAICDRGMTLEGGLLGADGDEEEEKVKFSSAVPSFGSCVDPISKNNLLHILVSKSGSGGAGGGGDRCGVLWWLLRHIDGIDADDGDGNDEENEKKKKNANGKTADDDDDDDAIFEGVNPNTESYQAMSRRRKAKAEEKALRRSLKRQSVHISTVLHGTSLGNATANANYSVVAPSSSSLHHHRPVSAASAATTTRAVDVSNSVFFPSPSSAAGDSDDGGDDGASGSTASTIFPDYALSKGLLLGERHRMIGSDNRGGDDGGNGENASSSPSSLVPPAAAAASPLLLPPILAHASTLSQYLFSPNSAGLLPIQLAVKLGSLSSVEVLMEGMVRVLRARYAATVAVTAAAAASVKGEDAEVGGSNVGGTETAAASSPSSPSSHPLFHPLLVPSPLSVINHYHLLHLCAIAGHTHVARYLLSVGLGSVPVTASPSPLSSSEEAKDVVGGGPRAIVYPTSLVGLRGVVVVKSNDNNVGVGDDYAAHISDEEKDDIHYQFSTLLTSSSSSSQKKGHHPADADKHDPLAFTSIVSGIFARPHSTRDSAAVLPFSSSASSIGVSGGGSPFMLACSYGHADLVAFFMEEVKARNAHHYSDDDTAAADLLAVEGLAAEGDVSSSLVSATAVSAASTVALDVIHSSLHPKQVLQPLLSIRSTIRRNVTHQQEIMADLLMHQRDARKRTALHIAADGRAHLRLSSGVSSSFGTSGGRRGDVISSRYFPSMSSNQQHTVNSSSAGVVVRSGAGGNGSFNGSLLFSTSASASTPIVIAGGSTNNTSSLSPSSPSSLSHHTRNHSAQSPMDATQAVMRLLVQECPSIVHCTDDGGRNAAELAVHKGHRENALFLLSLAKEAGRSAKRYEASDASRFHQLSVAHLRAEEAHVPSRSPMLLATANGNTAASAYSPSGSSSSVHAAAHNSYYYSQHHQQSPATAGSQEQQYAFSTAVLARQTLNNSLVASLSREMAPRGDTVKDMTLGNRSVFHLPAR